MTLRVGLIGLDRTGTHLLERLRFRPVFHVAAVHDADASRLESVAHLAERICPTLDDWLAEPCDVAVTTQCKWAAAALTAGRHVVLIPPVAPDVSAARELLAHADRAQRRLRVLRWDQEQVDFRMAQDVVASGKLGQLRTIRRSAASVALAGVNAWNTFAPTDFAQALDLLATLDGGRVSCPSPHPATLVELVHASRLSGMDGEWGGYLVVLQSPDGVLIEISRNVGAVLPEDTGWQLSGSRGGYAQGVRFVRSNEDEIFDFPIEPPPTIDPLDVLRMVVEDDGDDWRMEYLRAIEVVRLLAAAR